MLQSELPHKVENDSAYGKAFFVFNQSLIVVEKYHISLIDQVVNDFMVL